MGKLKDSRAWNSHTTTHTYWGHQGHKGGQKGTREGKKGAGEDKKGAGEDKKGAGEDKKGAGEDKKGAGEDKKGAGEDKKGAAPFYLCLAGTLHLYAKLFRWMVWIKVTTQRYDKIDLYKEINIFEL